MKDVVITQPVVGLAHMQVCVRKGVSDQDILTVCNRENPSGTTSGWTGVIRDGSHKAKPVQCADDPNREHIMVSC